MFDKLPIGYLERLDLHPSRGVIPSTSRMSRICLVPSVRSSQRSYLEKLSSLFVLAHGGGCDEYPSVWELATLARCLPSFFFQFDLLFRPSVQSQPFSRSTNTINSNHVRSQVTDAYPEPAPCGRPDGRLGSARRHSRYSLRQRQRRSCKHQSCPCP